MPLVIGIAGGTGSGKTSVARNISLTLADTISVVSIEQDHYYRDQPHLSLVERSRLNYDHPDAIDFPLLIEQITKLLVGRPIDKPLYDFVRHARAEKTERIEPAEVVIIEGILVFHHPDLRRLLDLKIYVDTDADIRILRRVRRDMEERGRSFESIRRQYYETVRPMHLMYVEPSKRWADLIIPEGGENRVAIDVVTAKIRHWLGETDRQPI